MQPLLRPLHPATATTSAPELVGLRSRTRIVDFRLHRPGTLAEAFALKLRHPEAWLMAGGVDVLNRLKTGLRISDVIHLGGIPALAAITDAGREIVVGAAVSHHVMATSPVVAAACPALAAAWRRIANPRIRFKGTVGGNVMADEPGYEALALLGAVGAAFCFASAAGPRILSADQLIARQTNAAPEPVILDCIRLGRAASRRLVHDRSLRAIVGVVLSADVVAGRIADARVAIGGAYRRPVVAGLPRLQGAAASTLPEIAADAAADWCRGLAEPRADHLASSSYRRRMIEVQLKRAIAALAREGAA